MKGLLAAILLCVAFATPAFGFCTDYESFGKILRDKYGEHRHAAGYMGTRQIVELWVADDYATWTLIIVEPNKRACLLMNGNAWATGDCQEMQQGIAGCEWQNRR